MTGCSIIAPSSLLPLTPEEGGLVQIPLQGIIFAIDLEAFMRAVALLALLLVSACGAIGEGRHRVQGMHVPSSSGKEFWLNPAYCVGNCQIRNR
jgi:hypothetical protein